MSFSSLICCVFFFHRLCLSSLIHSVLLFRLDETYYSNNQNLTTLTSCFFLIWHTASSFFDKMHFLYLTRYVFLIWDTPSSLFDTMRLPYFTHWVPYLTRYVFLISHAESSIFDTFRLPYLTRCVLFIWNRCLSFFTLWVLLFFTNWVLLLRLDESNHSDWLRSNHWMSLTNPTESNYH